MKIVLTISDSKGKNIAFATDTLAILTMEKALELSKRGELDGVHVVRRKSGKYLRSNPNVTSWDNLDYLSLTYRTILRAIDNVLLLNSYPGFRKYWQHYSAHLKDLEKNQEEIIYVDDQPHAPRQFVIQKAASVRAHILDAAKLFGIDSRILGAIMIDEITRFTPFEELTDASAVIGINTSVGIAQVTIGTARKLIRSGVYNPNPRDPTLSLTARIPNAKIYSYLIQPKYNIRFAAAKIRSDIDRWMALTGEDISQDPEKIGYLYSRGTVDEIKIDGRATQIKNEFYPLANNILYGE